MYHENIEYHVGPFFCTNGTPLHTYSFVNKFEYTCDMSAYGNVTTGTHTHHLLILMSTPIYFRSS